MQACAHQVHVIRIEQIRVVPESFRDVLPLRNNAVTIGCVLEVFTVDPDRPLVERGLLDPALLAQAGQYLGEVSPVLKPKIQTTKKIKRVTVVSRIFLQTT